MGSVIALTDADGDTVETYRYDVYGKPQILDNTRTVITVSAVGNNYMFTARRYDPETKLYHYRARMYNPTIGRFLQTDPIGYADGLNWYAYCGNNPIILIDPSGLGGESNNSGSMIETLSGAWNEFTSASGDLYRAANYAGKAYFYGTEWALTEGTLFVVRQLDMLGNANLPPNLPTPPVHLPPYINIPPGNIPIGAITDAASVASFAAETWLTDHASKAKGITDYYTEQSNIYIDQFEARVME